MLNLSIIGNLGCNARVEDYNGGKFVSFNVAHTERITKADGSTQERTTWVSCSLNGDGGNLLQYLKKGTKVFAWGVPSFRTFHSEQQRQLIVGVNLFVRSIELVGGSTDPVPRLLFNADGCQVDVKKYFWSLNETGSTRSLWSQSGQAFVQGSDGFIYAVSQENVQAETTAADSHDLSSESAPTFDQLKAEEQQEAKQIEKKTDGNTGSSKTKKK